jgi:hypothetical protein
MQIDMDTDIVYFVDDKESWSYFEYKTENYLPKDELFPLFTFVKGKYTFDRSKFLSIRESRREC